MKTARTMIAVLVCSVALLVVISQGRAQPGTTGEPAQTVADPITRLLANFSAALATLDADKAEALFLPPDASLDGKNRGSHIKEMKKDWAAQKGKSRMMSVAFTNTTVLVRTEMVVAGEEAHPRPTPVEFKVVLAPEGCKIVAMSYLKE